MFTNHLSASNQMVLNLQYFAKLYGLPVLRWRLPSPSDNSHNDNILSAISNEHAHMYPLMWGYHVQGMPVRINHNITLLGKVVNGSRATQRSIRPWNPDELRHLLANTDSIWQPGDLVTIDAPISITLTDVQGADQPFTQSIHLPVILPKSDIKRVRTIVLRTRRPGTRQTVKVVNPGCTSDFTGTVYSSKA
jgi:hypothetical protein